jgi:hypothetical protein
MHGKIPVIYGYGLQLYTDPVSRIGQRQMDKAGALAVQGPAAEKIELDPVPRTTQHAGDQSRIVQRSALVWAAILQQQGTTFDHHQQQTAPRQRENSTIALLEVEQVLKSNKHCTSADRTE